MKKVAVIGAGISGLFIANLFKRNKKYKVTIFERNSLINLKEGYGIQLSVNSIKLLNKIQFDKLKNNEKFNPDKINFYSVKNSNKICELNISNFNTEKCKYTTLKRSSLINFLKQDLEKEIKFEHTISKIEQQDQIVKITFENNEIHEFDYLIISDGVFSKSKSLLSKNQIEPKFNDTLAIRGIIPSSLNMADKKNISLFLGSNFHYVIYPVSPNGDLNFIGLMKFKLSEDEQKDYSLFNDNIFINKILDKVPHLDNEFFDNINDLKIYPVFVSRDFFEVNNNNIHLIGDAFFAFPPSFAQGASQSIEGAYELFENIENNTEDNFFKNRVNKTKMINNRSKFNQFAFHLSNPLTTLLRNIFLKRLVKNKKFLESYLGKIYRN
ncbi:FAD-dependent monooxygenase [Candidatus Pelagibacter sp. RS39]|uniref:FAD-dependent monooxygenase n=1 Tax=Candidatus Pelagibacter sp. RS39 TaxID=1977864 RepID=UPI000A14BA9D|nr:FAD-dependent monooxygenase [Candidatus Pelagibacter sp. RS39]ARJ48275.1 salicylate 1-monooxygenase [Candidatus Pelagibacter sp. RS39]